MTLVGEESPSFLPNVILAKAGISLRHPLPPLLVAPPLKPWKNIIKRPNSQNLSFREIIFDYE